MSDQEKAPNATENPYSDVEFEIFLREIGNANIKNWSIMAQALGVDRKTIWRWRQHPLAKEAISTAVAENLAEMTTNGKGDWRMNREKLNMLGVIDKQVLEHEVGEGVTNLLNELDKTDYGRIGREAKEQMVATESPVQDTQQTG